MPNGNASTRHTKQKENQIASEFTRLTKNQRFKSIVRLDLLFHGPSKGNGNWKRSKMLLPKVSESKMHSTLY